MHLLKQKTQQDLVDVRHLFVQQHGAIKSYKIHLFRGAEMAKTLHESKPAIERTKEQLLLHPYTLF